MDWCAGWMTLEDTAACGVYQSSLLLGMTSVLVLDNTIACSVLLPVELAPGNDLSAVCGGKQAVSQMGSAVDTSNNVLRNNCVVFKHSHVIHSS
jgi:hypothetical protein